MEDNRAYRIKRNSTFLVYARMSLLPEILSRFFTRVENCANFFFRKMCDLLFYLVSLDPCHIFFL